MYQNKIRITGADAEMVIDFRDTQKTVLFDASDIEKVGNIRWYILDDRGYVANDTKSKGKRIRTFLHRFITDANTSDCVDHINFDPTDNRKENLRVCTKSENTRHQRAKKDCTSEYKGVSWYPDYGKWRVRVGNKFVGYFYSELEAAKAYNQEAPKVHGEFAYLNKVS